jgi:TRAP-type uncharacterized transport system substrate-binding protein
MNHPKNTLTIAALAVLSGLSFNSLAEDTSSSNALRIGSGPDGKVYQLLVRDMQTVCGNEVPIVNVSTIGGIPNLMKLSASEADLGIVQLDTLVEIGRDGDENIQNLQAVIPLHTNLLHILSLRAGSRVGEMKSSFLGWNNQDTRDTKVVRKFSELKGLKIAAVGSTQLLGNRLNNQLGYGMDLRKAESDDDAVKMLKEGTVQAIFTDGGWPLPSVSRHKSDSGLQIVEYDLPAQGRFSIVKRNYQNLDAYNIQFLGSPNLLVTRPFKPNGDMGKKVAALQNCLQKNLEKLQEGRYHAAWKEIKNPTDTLGIARFGKPDAQKSTSR